MLALDFHVAVLDVPQLAVEIGLYDELLAAPPDGDGTLASRLAPWLRVYREPSPELAGLVSRFAALCAKQGKVAGCLLGDHTAAPLYQSLGIYLPLITTNCAVLGVALLNVQQGYGFLKSVFYGFGSALGFTIVLLIFAGLRERLALATVPAAFAGAPAAFITISLLSLAFMGFSGLVAV